MPPRFDKSELIRVPAGVLLIAIALSAGRQSLSALAAGGIGLLTGLVGLAIAVIFIAIGGVMALGWIGRRRKR